MIPYLIQQRNHEEMLIVNMNFVSADLEFLGSSIKRLDIKNSLVNLSPDVKLSFGIDTIIENIEMDSELNKRIGKMLLKVEIKAKVPKQNNKSSFSLEIEGCFATTEEDKFINMLYINGGSCLYSIARTIILNVSAQTYKNGKLTLPMINMVEFMNEKIRSEKGEVEAKSDKN